MTREEKIHILKDRAIFARKGAEEYGPDGKNIKTMVARYNDVAEALEWAIRVLEAAA